MVSTQTIRTLLLPVLGLTSAVLAFKLAQPFEATLVRPGIGLDNPAAQFTVGTRWGDVNRLAFGALICGTFTFALTLGRRAWWRVLIATVLGTVLGAGINYATDSGSDLLGLAIDRAVPMVGNFVADLTWCVVVPAGIAYAILIAIGMTRERLRRASMTSVVASVASFASHIVVGVLAGPMVSHQLAGSLVGGQQPTILTFLPVWRMEEMAVGLALGFAFLIGDYVFRIGTIRLVLGRNEGRDWSLDHPISRIGSSEGCEIPVRGLRGVAPVHAHVAREGRGFVLRPVHEARVNGTVVTVPAMLCNRDQIQIGEATLVFYGDGVPSRAPVPRPVPQVQPAEVPAVRMLVDAAGGRYALPPGRYGIGRDQSNHICLLSNASVSRRHAELIVTGSGVEVVDLGSSNGTRVNGAPVTSPAPANPGDVIEFGGARFTVG